MDIFPTEYSLNKLPLTLSQIQKQRFFILPVGLTWATGGGHQNALIFDNKRKEVELFEPYGNLEKTIQNAALTNQNFKILLKDLFDGDLIKYYNQPIYFQNMENFVTLLTDGKYKFFSPVSYLPEKGLQEIEELKCKDLEQFYNINTKIGFCVAWTMFYIEQRVTNSDKTRTQLVKKIFDRIDQGQGDNYVCRVIRDYTAFLLNLYDNKTLMDKLKFDFSTNYKLYAVRSLYLSAFFSVIFSSILNSVNLVV